MNGRMDDLENENKSLKTQVNHLETQNISLNNVLLQQAKDIEAVKLHAVKNEQYSRKYNLKMYGINESKDESCSEKVCATVKAKLDVNLERKQIATAHRIAGREGKARPLLVRLHKHDTKITPSGLGGRYRHFIGHIRKLLGIFENNLGLCGEFPLVSMSTTPPSDVSYDFKYILSFYDIIMV